MTKDNKCKICHGYADLGKFCESCALDGEKLYLKLEGNITTEEIETGLRERYKKVKCKKCKRVLVGSEKGHDLCLVCFK